MTRNKVVTHRRVVKDQSIFPGPSQLTGLKRLIPRHRTPAATVIWGNLLIFMVLVIRKAKNILKLFKSSHAPQTNNSKRSRHNEIIIYFSV